MVSEVDSKLRLGRIAKLHKFEGASDHGSPSILKVPSGKYKGHIIACYSNHSSPLFMSRTSRAEDIGAWDSPKIIDVGRSTYVSLAALPDGKIILMHTLQERVGKHSSGEWRKVVARTSEDGGDTWGEPVQIAGLGAGTFPYSTPIAISSTGQCVMTYAIYSAAEQRHQGLVVTTTRDAFKTNVQIPIELGSAANIDTVPFETKWISETLVAVSYTEMSQGGERGLSRVAIVNVESGECISNDSVGYVAVHTYAGGACVSRSGRNIFYSPETGGIVMKDLSTGNVTSVLDEGHYSSPSLFELNGQSLLIALKSPKIETTRKFSSSLLIMKAYIG